MPLDAHTTLIACAGIQPELNALREKGYSFLVHYLGQGLHRTPGKMSGLIQEALDAMPPTDQRVVLGYGLCSMGILGVRARAQLIIPRQHDCISFYLQPDQLPVEAALRHHTYYLTPGWLRARKDPLTIVEEVYTPRVGREKAVWAMNRELRHYRFFVFVNTQVCDPRPLRRRTMENAEFFGKEYREVQSGLDYFKKLVTGPYTEPDFILLEPGEVLGQSAWGL